MGSPLNSNVSGGCSVLWYTTFVWITGKQLSFFFDGSEKHKEEGVQLFWPIKTYRGHQKDVLYIFVGPKETHKDLGHSAST